MTAARFPVEGVFQIAGRGTVVAIGQATGFFAGQARHATIFRPDGTQFTARAFKEWLLRRDPCPLEKEAYLLHGIEKAQIPEGSSIQIEAI